MPDETRPTFGQALEAAEAKLSSSAPSDAGAPSAPEPAAAPEPASPATVARQPEADETTAAAPSAEEETGPIPFDRHKAILQKRTDDTRNEALAAMRRDYGWAMDLGPENFAQVVQMMQSYAANPVQFIADALNDLNAHPQYAQQIRTHIARALASRGISMDDEPQPDLDLGNGVTLYSAKQQAARDQWAERQTLNKFRAELEPIQRDLSQRAERDRVAQIQSDANQFARDTIAKMEKLPYFNEYRKDIETTFAAMPPMPDQLVGQAILEAYVDVLQKKALPNLSNSAQSALISDLNTKAAAATRPPTGGAPAQQNRPKTFEEGFKLVAGKVAR